MATLETQQVDAIIDTTRRKMLTVGGAALAGLAFAGADATPAKAQSSTASQTDIDILNFALNLEYLEAQFYNLAVYGVTIDKLSSAQGGPISILGGQAAGSAGMVTLSPGFAKVPFTSGGLIQSYATETALEEGKHVTFLQGALGSSAVAMPNLDLYNSFNALGQAVGVGSFNPFASETFFLLGAYIFEDVGVSAYHGAAGLITDKVNVLPPAVGIHAVEAYHAGLIRVTIASLDAQAGNTTLSTLTQKISAVRTTLTNAVAGSSPANDNGIASTTVALEGSAGQYTALTLVDAPIASGYSIGAGRSAQQVLSIVTDNNSGAGAASTAPTYSGLFFPNGLNGNIR